MKRMNPISLLKIAGLALALGASTAQAQPSNVSGAWQVKANAHAGTLHISQQSSNRVCKPIKGIIYSSAIEGYYCPSTGRIVFARYLRGTDSKPFQFYEGHLSRDNRDMAGSFSVWNGTGGGLSTEGVDFNFNATRAQKSE